MINRHEARKAWLAQGGVDKSAILDILVYKEVRFVARDLSMAEVLENAAEQGVKPAELGEQLTWYEQEYWGFMKGWVDANATAGATGNI